MTRIQLAAIAAICLTSSSAYAQAWRDCVPGSIGQGGCDSIGPGGGRSIAPGGGLSIGPGGGLSIGPGGGQSIGPGGGQSIGPGGGKSIMRDRSRGLDPDTLRPYPNRYGGAIAPHRSTAPSPFARPFPSPYSNPYLDGGDWEANEGE
jgi:hypothetical protein